MRTLPATLAAALVALALGAPRLEAQEWSPPSRTMPQMLAPAVLDGDGWRGPSSGWVPASASAARGEGSGAGGKVRFVRFTGGVRPAATWSDRNGDGTCDMLEIYSNGALAYQLVDADYDGTADVLRVYEGGKLARENRL